MDFSPQLAAAALGIPAAALLAWRLTGSALDKFLTRKFTVLYDIDNLGPEKARPDDKRIRGTAVICGGSIGGLWAALVASDHFEDVVIVEPEAWVFTQEGMSNTYDENGAYIEKSRENVRSRCVQYHADHVFQPIALDALRKYFPNIDDEIRKANGIVSEYQVNCYCHGRKIMALPRGDYPDGKYPQCFFMSRELYERLLRRLVLGYSPRIRTKAATVTALNPAPEDPMTISTVTVRLPDGVTEDIPAALIIDCSGGTQAGLKWLRRIETDPVNAGALKRYTPSGALSWDDVRTAYNTAQKYIRFRFYVPPEARQRLPIPGGYENSPWLYTYFPIPNKERKLFMINRIEGHRFELAFGGWGEPPLPENVSEIKDWFKGLEKDHQKVPDWFYPFLDILMEQKDTVEIGTGRYPSLSWVRYENARYVPHNFIAIGDSVMQPNPTFGQGCSKATIGAVVLDTMLKSKPYSDSTKIPPNFGREFFTLHKDKIQGVWDGTKPTDYQFDTTTPAKGEKRSDEWLMGGVGNIAMELAGLDKELDAALYKVRFFMAPQTALMTPKMLSKIVFFIIRKKLGLIPS